MGRYQFPYEYDWSGNHNCASSAEEHLLEWDITELIVVGRGEEKDLSESFSAFLRKRYGRVLPHWNYHLQDLSP